MQRTTQCIILFTIVVIFIDWFIWNNIINTSFFISILIIYIYYNLQNIKLISIFINTTENLNKTEYLNSIDILDTNTDTSRIKKQNNNYNISKCDIPLNLSKYTRQHTQNTQTQKHQPQQPREPLPYNKYNNENNNTLIDVYKTDKPNTYITDKNYAEIILHNLYSDYI